MTYRINGKTVSREEFMAGAKPIEWGEPFRLGVIGDYESYQCPVTGKVIEGRAAHRENLKHTGCRVLEDGESRDYSKRAKAERTERLHRVVDEAFNSISGEF